MTKVLFVCMGNICRSPTAEAVFRHLVHQQELSHRFEIDSAGTHDYHVGYPPDHRMQKAALARGYDLSKLKARQVDPVDFEYYDYILAMDNHNMDCLLDIKVDNKIAKVELFLNYAVDQDDKEVPDPYYGGEEGFEHVMTLIEYASQGFLETIQKNISK